MAVKMLPTLVSASGSVVRKAEDGRAAGVQNQLRFISYRPLVNSGNFK